MRNKKSIVEPHIGERVECEMTDNREQTVVDSEELNRLKLSFDARCDRLSSRLSGLSETNTALMDVGPTPLSDNTESGWLLPNTRSTRAAATIVSIMNEDSALIEIPNHLWGLKSYIVGSSMGKEDREVVATGWIHIQRMSLQFSSIFQPTESHFGEAVEFLRDVVQEAANMYYSRVEKAVVLYVNLHFIKPVATTDAETVEFETDVDTMSKACRRLRVSMTRDKTCPRWNNWFHLYQVLKGLWEDKPGNQLSPNNFIYEFLKQKRVKTPTINRRELAKLDKEFLDQLYPNRKSDPYQSPLIQRVGFLRNNKLYERIKKHTAKSTGLTFLIDRPRGNKEFQKQDPYHTWKEIEGRRLFYLYDQKVQEHSIAGTSQRKRDRVEGDMETQARLKLDQSDTVSTNDVQGNIKVMQSAFNGTPTLKSLIEMIEELHGRGAYLEYIRIRQSRTDEEQQALSGITYQQQLENLAYYPANEITYRYDEQRTQDPSTLTGSIPDNSENKMAGVQGMMAIAHQANDYDLYAETFNDHLEGLDDMELSPEKIHESMETTTESRVTTNCNKVGPSSGVDKPKEVEIDGTAELKMTNNPQGDCNTKDADDITILNDIVPEDDTGADTEGGSWQTDTDKLNKMDCGMNKGGQEEKTESEEESTKNCEGKNELRIPKYDTISYMRTVTKEITVCSGCQEHIGESQTVYICNNCTNGHKLCNECMENADNDTLEASECKHGVYEDAESYERCTGTTYSWMNKQQPSKKCSTCGLKNKPTIRKPLFYCRKCHLHRVCMDCWRKEEVKDVEKESRSDNARLGRRRTKER